MENSIASLSQIEQFFHPMKMIFFKLVIPKYRNPPYDNLTLLPGRLQQKFSLSSSLPTL